MKHNIIPGLAHLATPVGQVKYLPNNPHKADMEKLTASLKEFGQHKPIVARGDPERGGYAVIGNHTHEAAVRLGWTHVAVVWVDEDENRALARGMADNIVQASGEDDQDLMGEALSQVIDFYPETFAVLGYDEFEVASMEPSVYTSPERGYEPPQMVGRDDDGDTDSPASKTPALEGRSSEDLIKTGAGDTDDKRKAVIQYTLVFSSSDQQRRWYDFMKYLREDPAIDGETTVDRLLSFCESHADF